MTIVTCYSKIEYAVFVMSIRNFFHVPMEDKNYTVCNVRQKLLKNMGKDIGNPVHLENS